MERIFPGDYLTLIKQEQVVLFLYILFSERFITKMSWSIELNYFLCRARERERENVRTIDVILFMIARQ